MDKKKLKFSRINIREKRVALTGMVERTENYGREAVERLLKTPPIRLLIHTPRIAVYQSTADRFLLQLVEEALRRISDGEYGVCTHCEKEVHKATGSSAVGKHCIICQDLQERGLLDRRRRRIIRPLFFVSGQTIKKVVADCMSGDQLQLYTMDS